MKSQAMEQMPNKKMSYEEMDTCMAYEEEDTCLSLTVDSTTSNGTDA